MKQFYELQWEGEGMEERERGATGSGKNVILLSRSCEVSERENTCHLQQSRMVAGCLRNRHGFRVKKGV